MTWSDPSSNPIEDIRQSVADIKAQAVLTNISQYLGLGIFQTPQEPPMPTLSPVPTLSQLDKTHSGLWRKMRGFLDEGRSLGFCPVCWQTYDERHTTGCPVSTSMHQLTVWECTLLDPVPGVERRCESSFADAPSLVMHVRDFHPYDPRSQQAPDQADLKSMAAKTIHERYTMFPRQSRLPDPLRVQALFAESGWQDRELAAGTRVVKYGGSVLDHRPGHTTTAPKPSGRRVVRKSR